MRHKGSGFKLILNVALQEKSDPYYLEKRA